MIKPNTMVLKCGRQEIVEIGALKPCGDELMERERLHECLRNPAHEQAGCVGSEGQKRSTRMQARMRGAAKSR